MYIAQFGRIAFPNGRITTVQAAGTMKNGVDYTVMATVTYDQSLQCERSKHEGGGGHCGDDNSNNNSKSSDGIFRGEDTV